jgi:uncharacterized membrane protein YgcG
LRKPKILLTLAVAVPLAACSSSPKSLDDVPEFNSWLATAMQDAAIRNAILAQHTLFPYHFEMDSEHLNELGKLDLAILAGHYLDRSGELSVRRGDAGKDLYDARVAMVQSLFERAGVGADRIKITDSLAGGEGLSSENVVRILEQDREMTSGRSSRSGQSRSGGMSGDRNSGSGSGGSGSGSSSGTQSGSGARQ